MKKFDKLKIRLKKELDLNLERNNSERALGWVNGSWKTGYSVSGYMPERYNIIRFSTLKQVEKAMINNSWNTEHDE